MTDDEFARMVSLKVWPEYLKAKNSGKGRPNMIAFGQRLYVVATKIAEDYVNHAKKEELSDAKLIGMEIVYDEALVDGEFELRWDE